MSRRAIVTLVVGGPFLDRWETLCRRNWEDYSRSIGADLVVIAEPQDLQARAQSRSPSWQKLLLPAHPEVSCYEQVAWVDSDILFNIHRPESLFDGVPLELVGAVDSFADPSPSENAEALRRMWYLVNRGIPGKRAPGQYSTPDEIYVDYGSPVVPVGRMINAGVLVFSPTRHGEVFRHVYDRYEDRGSPSYYENVPLAFELVKRGLVHWLDPKFNHLWAWDKLIHYPFMQEWSPRSFPDKILRRLAMWCGNDYERRAYRRCATAALLNCQCLHFAGCAQDMELVDQEAAARGHVGNLGV